MQNIKIKTTVGSEDSSESEKEIVKQEVDRVLSPCMNLFPGIKAVSTTVVLIPFKDSKLIYINILN